MVHNYGSGLTLNVSKIENLNNKSKHVVLYQYNIIV